MSEEIRSQIENTILRLENVVQDQTQLYLIWSDVKTVLINELNSLPSIPNSNNKK